PEAWPEKPPGARAQSKGAVPIGVKVECVARPEIYSRVADFALTLNFRIQDTISLGDNPSSVSAGPIAKTVRQSQIVATTFNIIGEQFQFCWLHDRGRRLWTVLGRARQSRILLSPRRTHQSHAQDQDPGCGSTTL